MKSVRVRGSGHFYEATTFPSPEETLGGEFDFTAWFGGAMFVFAAEAAEKSLGCVKDHGLPSKLDCGISCIKVLNEN